MTRKDNLQEVLNQRAVEGEQWVLLSHFKGNTWKAEQTTPTTDNLFLVTFEKMIDGEEHATGFVPFEEIEKARKAKSSKKRTADGYIQIGAHKMPAYQLSNGDVWRNTKVNKEGEWLRVEAEAEKARFIQTGEYIVVD